MQLAREFPEIQFVFSVHPNPSVSNPVRDRLSGKKNICLIPPQGYLDFLFLMKKASLVLTDSGGIQEEAPSLGVPVLVMREVTERTEALIGGRIVLVGSSMQQIISMTRKFLNEPQRIGGTEPTQNPYGDGKAAEKIVSKLLML